MAFHHGPFSSDRTIAITENLVFYVHPGSTSSWPGSGTTWYDISNNSNNVTLINQEGGLDGEAFSHNGLNQYGTMNGFAGVLSTGDAFTISIWFYSNSGTTAYKYSRQLWSCHDSSYNNKARVALNCVNGGTGYFVPGEWDSQVDDTVGSTSYRDSTWHNLTITRPAGSNQTGTWRTDGSSDGTKIINPPWDDVAYVSIAQEWDGGPTVSDVWQGWIGSIAIYNTALSAVEISQNFEIQRGYYGV